MSYLWKRITGREEPWQRDCIYHDKAYWKGGTKEDKKNADLCLGLAVFEMGYPWWAFLMYLIITVFGSGYLPFPWRWGFGENYFHNLKYGVYKKSLI